MVGESLSDLFQSFTEASRGADAARQALGAFLPTTIDDETPPLVANFNTAYQVLILAEEAEKEARGALFARLRPEPMGSGLD